MARTYTKLIYHLVFSTKERVPLITEEIRDRLYQYLGGVIRGEKGSLLEIGGVADHVHLLARFGAAIAVSDMVQRIKGNSSHWLNQPVPRVRKYFVLICHLQCSKPIWSEPTRIFGSPAPNLR